MFSSLFKKLILTPFLRKEINIIEYQYRLYNYTNIMLNSVDRFRNLQELIYGQYSFEMVDILRKTRRVRRIYRYE
jgi:hypothetical protein